MKTGRQFAPREEAEQSPDPETRPEGPSTAADAPLETKKAAKEVTRDELTTEPSHKTAKKSANDIKAELTALKNPRLQKTPTRGGTPIRNPYKRQIRTLSPTNAADKTTLPLKYSQLLEMFKHLQLAYRLRKNKSSFLTYAEAKTVIQKATRKTFSIHHLAKMKFMIPDILIWRYMEGDGDALASSRLVISLDPPEGQGNHRGGSEDLLMYNELRERLASHARRASLIGKENEDLPEADLPDPSLSLLVSSSKALSGRSWSNSSSGYTSRSPASVNKPRRSITPLKQPEESPVFVTPKRLTTVSEDSKESVGCTSSYTPITPQKRPSLLSPCSDNRRSLMRESFKRRMLMSPSKVKARAKSQAMTNLVQTLNDVRGVFHRFRTTKRPLKDVLQALVANTKSRYTEESAKLHLHLLLEHAPQYVKLEVGAAGKDVVSVDNECNLKEIKEMLKEVAETRPRVEVSEAEVDKHLKILEEFDL